MFLFLISKPKHLLSVTVAFTRACAFLFITGRKLHILRIVLLVLRLRSTNGTRDSDNTIFLLNLLLVQKLIGRSLNDILPSFATGIPKTQEYTITRNDELVFSVYFEPILAEPEYQPNVFSSEPIAPYTKFSTCVCVFRLESRL